MGTLRLLYALALVLSLQLASSQPAEGGMMQNPGIQIRDTLQTPLETQAPEEASRTSEGLPGPLHSPPGPRQLPLVQVDSQDCNLQSLVILIKDLGLGYNSEETMRFNYCSGSCPRARTNYDMTLDMLMRKREIPPVGGLCCRPSSYEDMVFLDEDHQWHTVGQLSAISCVCMG
ncbi:UNVERIFIED_CONTAM: hypothetical protein K2H54_053113 [Gekko kuhli]